MLNQIRPILQDSVLTEDYKWSQPCYTLDGANVLIMSCFKDYAFISFFKGSLLKDEQQLLDKPGKNSQAWRQLRFTTPQQVIDMEPVIRAYIQEAIEIEKAGLKVEFKQNPEPLPEELLEAFEADAEFQEAFEALTPGRQRGYILYFSGAKQSATRASRIEKHWQNILDGKGIHDR
ncbi:MAG: YdeI/OmpD-associated family protein [Bacteroidia bacterium]